MKPSMPDPVEQKRLRKAVAEAFGLDWLNDRFGKNPVQKLWRRTDHLADVEILTTGEALLNMSPKHQGWLKGVVSDAKKGDMGKLFEAICLSMFESDPAVAVIPADSGEEGYDAELHFSRSKTELLLSIKNHAM